MNKKQINALERKVGFKVCPFIRQEKGPFGNFEDFVDGELPQRYICEVNGGNAVGSVLRNGLPVSSSAPCSEKYATECSLYKIGKCRG